MVSSVGCNFFAFFSKAGRKEADERDGDFIPVGEGKPFLELRRWEYVEFFVSYKC